ncbi:MAG: PD-(D/E)XK nuclease family protein [Salinivirgaceae bacterium]|nr:PD-(D/E)XK nuclease family protein [Salinivirgaceae bacterium]
MRIIFSPEYSGIVYVKPADGTDVLMDTLVTNTVGLVNMLELRLGLHYEGIPAQERAAHYYDAVCRYMAAHPDNVLAASFRTSGLSTAKVMLGWRDELRSANWNFDGAEISDRLAVLIGVEEHFREMDRNDMACQMQAVIDRIKLQNPDLKDITIELPVAKDLLKPMTKALIEMLEACGAKTEPMAQAKAAGNNLSRVREFIESKKIGEITLDKNDDSLQIWKFGDDRLACEYLAFNDMDDVDVWINADNKQMDNWLMLMEKAKTGSVTAGCTPQLTQLFVMGLGMFASPLNVSMLIEWLNMPLHPINKLFRSVLAGTIVSKGGYRNEFCKEKIKEYVEGKFIYLDDKQKALPKEEQEKIIQKKRVKCQKYADLFLPPIDAPQSIETARVRQFVSELSSWARQRAHMEANKSDNEQWVEQLLAVAEMCDTFHILLGTVSADTIDYKTIDSWMSTVYEKGCFTNAVAEKGCRTVVDSPAKIASVAKKTVWIGVDGDASIGQECSFLYPSEKTELGKKNYVRLWAEEAENSYHEQMMLTPLRQTSGQLILVVRERIGGEPTLKHPLIVRLERQIGNIEDFVRYPSVGVESRHKVDMVKPDGEEGISAELKFDYADKIKWPDHLSPTAIDTLVEYPFDYMMEHLLEITNAGKAKMEDIKKTMGNVAHAVIERLFAPRNGARYSKPDEIAARIDSEYEDIYNQVLEGKGALLQLVENKFKQKLLHEQMRTCLNILLEILKDNELKVTGCERFVEGQLNLNLPKALDGDGNEKNCDMVGFIDMTLEDKDGHPVVFDFKWTTWVKGYRSKLAENRSVQLELYRWMLGREQKDEVRRVAYFLMPEGLLLSQEEFKGRHYTRIEPENRNNIVEQLRQSALYRMEQIKNGVVETTGAYDDLQYVKDTETRGLFPLKQDENGQKEGNFFTVYGLFNR